MSILKVKVLLASIILSGLILFKCPHEASAELKYRFVLKFGVPGTGNGQFGNPVGISLDSFGNIFVVDTNNSRIQKFDSLGNYLSQFGSFGTNNGQLKYPEAITVNKHNEVYVSDYGNNRLEKYSNSGVYQSKIVNIDPNSASRTYGGPRGIFTDINDNITVAVTDSQFVARFDSLGSNRTQFGSFGTGNGMFNGPDGIAIDSKGNIFVSDIANNRIQKFDKNGNYLTQFGQTNSGSLPLNRPRGIALDSSGNLFVADYNNDCIQIFDNSGAYLTRFGSTGTADGQLKFPRSVTLDFAGNVYVTDTGNNRVQKFKPISIPRSVVLDIDGDNKNDILLQNSTTGDVVYWLLNGAAISSAGYVSKNGDSKWKVVATPDINRDGFPDILTQYQSAGTYPKGTVQYWQMFGTTIKQSGILYTPTDPNFNVVSTMRSGENTILILQHSVTGVVKFVTVNPNFTLGTVSDLQNTNQSEWKVVGHPDWLGNSSPTILSQNINTSSQYYGSLFYWNLNSNMSITSYDYLAKMKLGTWGVVGTPDLNHDGTADILFQDPITGGVYCWLLGSSHQIIGGGFLWTGGDPNWKIKYITDLTNSNSVSIVFQNSSNGAMVYWNLNGLYVSAIGSIFSGSLPGWNLITPR